MADVNSFEIFPWNDNFETGIEIIDQQHQKLVDIINELANQLANCSNANILDEVFVELADYAAYHFKTEEAIWHEHLVTDDWFIEHQKTHERFFEQVMTLKNNKENLSFDEVIHQMLSFLTQWLAAHILEKDKRFAIVVLNIKAGHSLEKAKELANEEMSGATKVLIKTVLTMYDSLSTRSIELMREKALRKQAEQKLLESEERWRFLIDNQGDSVWDWNIEQNSFNASSYDPPLLDIASGNLFNKHHQSNIHPTDIAQVKKDLQAHLNGETDFYINKHRVFRSDKNCWSWILSKGKVVTWDEKGNALRMIGVHIDISEKELATQIYRNSSQAMFVTDINKKIIAINPAFEEITKLNASEVIGKNPNTLISNFDNHQLEEIQNSLQQTGTWYGEVWGKHQNGDDYCLAVNINIVADNEGTIAQYIGLFSDITEKKQNEQILLQKEQEKRDIFNATISSTYHIVNNLLNQMMFFKLQVEELNALDTDMAELYEQMMTEGKKLVEQLAAVEELTEESIKASIADRNL